LVSVEVIGKKRPDTVNVVSKLTISKNQWVVTYRDFASNTQATIEIDPSKDPKTIDLTFRGEELPARGIYKLEGDTLTVCYNATVGGERPKEFKSTQEMGVLEVWKRAKKLAGTVLVAVRTSTSSGETANKKRRRATHPGAVR
jgi:uncharacterized protein (TIGR03067 family)